MPLPHRGRVLWPREGRVLRLMGPSSPGPTSPQGRENQVEKGNQPFAAHESLSDDISSCKLLERHTIESKYLNTTNTYKSQVCVCLCRPAPGSCHVYHKSLECIHYRSACERSRLFHKIHFALFWWKIGVKIRYFPHFCWNIGVETVEIFQRPEKGEKGGRNGGIYLITFI